jgi:hypothetical protein
VNKLKPDGKPMRALRVLAEHVGEWLSEYNVAARADDEMGRFYGDAMLKLVQLGLVRRRWDSADGGRYLYSITFAGEALLSRSGVS